MMVACSPYVALTRHLRSLDRDVASCSYTFGELHAALGCRLPMGSEIASAWEGADCALGRAVAIAGFTARLQSTDRSWVVTFSRRRELAGGSWQAAG